jgi:hypothetical protein
MSKKTNRAILTATCVISALSLGAASTARSQTAANPATTEVAKPSCPPVASQADAVGKTNGAGLETPPAQPMERSAILPATGGEINSVAPSVKQGGTDVVAGVDCPMAPNHPNALKAPGPLPEPSKAPPQR